MSDIVINNKKLRKLRKDELKVRVQSVNEYGAILLIYKDARCDMNVLDELVGPMNWKREHSRDNHNCIVSIWDGQKQQWVSKEDTGTQSNTEKEKGLASDSFKRACTNWGIGRELYDAPKIKIPKDLVNIKSKDKNGRKQYYTYDTFRVARITYNRFGMIDGLAIKNQKNQVVFIQEPKDIQHIVEPEEIDDVVTSEERIDDSAVQHVETVETPFETSEQSDIIESEAPKGKSLQGVMNRITEKFVESDEVGKANEDGPGF